MSHINVQHPETKLWRCFSTNVDDWICGWMTEDDYKEWLIDKAVESMREEFERRGIQSATLESYNYFVYNAACTQWKYRNCNECDGGDCGLCFVYTNDWRSYAERYADDDVLGIIPDLVIPEE